MYLEKGRRLGGLFLWLFLLAWPIQVRAGEAVDKAQAVEIAKKEVSFEALSVNIDQDCEEGRKVWVVTLRSTPTPDPMGKVMIITIDMKTGRVLALARN